MAKDRDGDALGANQSKKPPSVYLDIGDQPYVQQPPQQHPRVKTQKHIVGGGTGGRLHARVPSSKGLKHHAAASTAKLNRKHGSVSPDRGSAFVLPSHHHHRRTTSELKLTGDPSASNLKKNLSQTNLKRNRSHVDVRKRTKSTTSLHRSASNPAVDKLRSSGSSRVQFNLGDDGQADDQDDDEWVDASTSASPLLSRRGSAVSAGQTAHPPEDDEEDQPPASPSARRHEDTSDRHPPNGSQNSSQSLPRNTSIHNQYLTSRILSRTPSHGAPPMMSTETVSARPASLLQYSPPTSSPGHGPSLSGTPGTAPQVRPGSSGKAELTSRFVGNNSQEPGSGIPGESFMLAANRGGLSRAALNGKAAFSAPQRRQSLGSLSQARGIDAMASRQVTMDDVFADDDDSAQTSRSRRTGDYVVPREMNRTQQKLNLQRASSSLEPSQPHAGIAGVSASAGGLMGVPNNYDSRDPRIGKLLERTGMEYLTVRRHLNPVARSVSRVMQLPGLEDSRRIPRSSRHSARVSELGGGGALDFTNLTHRERERDRDHPSAGFRHSNSMADLIHGGQPSTTSTSSSRRPLTPRGGGGAFPGLHSASSSLDTDGGGANGPHVDRQRLSGSSLVDGAEDAGTLALLRMMWDKSLDLGVSSQD